MNLFYKTLLSVATILTISISTIKAEESQLSTSEQIAQLTAAVSELQADLAATKQQLATETTSKRESGFYTPTVFGTLLTSFAVSTYDGATRFNVRNSRFGVKGNAATNLSYYMQIDFHNQGSISVLDAYVRYKREKFDVTLGQQHIHLSTELDRGPSSNFVNSRSYSTIISTAYYSIDEDGAYSTDSFGSRDIGAYFNYYYDVNGVPVTFGAGVFNGQGTNSVEWTQTMNYTARVMIGNSKKGLYGGGSYYWGTTAYVQDMNILTAELSYKRGGLNVEGIYQQRHLHINGVDRMQFGVVQGYYKFDLDKNKVFSYVSPTFRWDCGDDVQYDNIITDSVDNFNVNRLTPQINIGFTGEKIRSRIGISYEKVFLSDTPSDIASNNMMQDKFTIAVVAAF